MSLFACTDPSGFEGILIKGRTYRGQRLPLGTIKIGALVFSADRFQEVRP